MQFSLTSRKVIFDTAATSNFDLLIIGGGVTGCGIALDAAMRGMKVILLEKADFASGTSSRSTKLIHGGLRYLKQMELKLVHDVGSERAIVYRNARHLVIPEKMLLPIIKNGSLGKGPTSLALWVYDLLAGVKASERRKMLDRIQTLEEEPLLNPEKVIGGGLYYEYRTDDSRLVIELAKSAWSKGALCLNYAGVKEFIYKEQDLVAGVKITDQLNGGSFDVRATKVVNAAGPYVDLLRKEDKSLFGKRLQLTKGVHIVFPYDKLPLGRAVYFDMPDGRMVFVIPRDGVCYAGTTDTLYNEDIDRPLTTKKDAEYLIDGINLMFPSARLQLKDIISSWAGLRPLIFEDGKSPSELSRKDEIIISSSGLISIAGGKLTGYRLMAKKVTDLVAKELISEAKVFGRSGTRNFRLSGANFSSDNELQVFKQDLLQDLAYSAVPQNLLNRWVNRYGRNTTELLKYLPGLKSEYANSDELALAAEILYGFDNEMVSDELDFAIRRTGMIYFDKQRLDQYYIFIHSFFNRLLKRKEPEQKAALLRFRQAIEAVTTFR